MKLKLIVLVLTLFSFSCSNISYNISNVTFEENIKIKDSIIDPEIELIIKPFRDKIKTSKDLKAQKGQQSRYSWFFS